MKYPALLACLILLAAYDRPSPTPTTPTPTTPTTPTQATPATIKAPPSMVNSNGQYFSPGTAGSRR